MRDRGATAGFASAARGELAKLEGREPPAPLEEPKPPFELGSRKYSELSMEEKSRYLSERYGRRSA